MAREPTAYERLSIADRAFLACEDHCKHMHLGGVVLFEVGPLATACAGVDVQRIRAHVASRLHLIPRYRQRLAWIPLHSHPVWVDDAEFDIAYHVRHVAVPRPGDEEKLKDLCGEIMSQQLNRAKPLWEIWILEGLAAGGFAMLVKTHHCMVDGIAAFELFSALLSLSPDEVPEPAPRWVPRPTPGRFTLLRDELVRRATVPPRFLRAAVDALRRPRALRAQLVEAVLALRGTAESGFRMARDTPLNRPVGPHRRFDWCVLDLAAVKAVKNRLGGSVNDVVLAVVAGAVRRFLAHRGVDPRAVDFRAVVPVNVRTPGERAMVTNRVSAWQMALPIGESDARKRLAAIREAVARVRATKQELGPIILGQAAELAPPLFLAAAIRIASHMSPYNIIITNVAGPQVPLYLLGARLVVGYPQMPLFEKQSLGVAVFSYAGQLAWGFNADWDALPDLSHFVADVQAEFRELEETP